MSAPATSTLPELGRTIPQTMLIKVVLPAPFGPSRPKISPARTSNDTSSTDVNGAPATLITTRDGSMAGVIWVDRGVVTGVAGSLSADEVLAVARGLRTP